MKEGRYEPIGPLFCPHQPTEVRSSYMTLSLLHGMGFLLLTSLDGTDSK